MTADPRNRLGVVLASHYFAPHVGGIESVVRSHARRLAARGHDVTVLTTDVGSARSTERRDGYEIRRMAAWNPFESVGVPYPVPNPVTARRTIRAELDDDVDIVHAHGINYLTTAAVLGWTPAEVPTFLHQHTPFVDYPAPLDAVERANDALVGRYNLRHADRVFCVSRNIERYVHDLAPDATTSVMPNGVDTRIFSPDRAPADPPFDCDPATPVFFAVSRLSGKKGVDVLIEAARRLEASAVDAHLAVAGDGPMRDDVEAAARSRRDLEYLGRVSDDELAGCYAAADAVLFTSKSGEAFPTLTMLEAYASGTPVVASKLAAPPDGVDDGENTVLIEPDRPAAVVDAVRELATDPERLETMGRAARATATRRFSIESRIDRLETAYRSAVGSD